MFRNGDWITPSREYAIDNAEVHGWDDYRIIEQEVPIDTIWWDENDINERDYDDGKDYVYKNTENNRKLADKTTYDDNGAPIPLNQRFDENNSDVRYSTGLTGEELYGNAEEEQKRINEYVEKVNASNLDGENNLITINNTRYNSETLRDVSSLNEERNKLSGEASNGFRTIQEESIRQYSKSGWGTRSQPIDETLRRRYANVFREELECRGYNYSNDNGLLKDTGSYKIKKIDGSTFHDIFSTTRLITVKGELVDVHPVDTNEDWTGYNDCANYLSDDGLSGFSIAKVCKWGFLSVLFLLK